jgi:crotonobetaine/carnitine-CoA ligase
VARHVLDGADRTVPALLRRGAERNGDRVALRSRSGSATFAEAYTDARRVAGGLAALGVARGDHVALLLDNSLDFYRCWFGVNVAGAVEVAVNTGYRGDGLQYIVEHSEAEVLVVEEALLERVAEIAPRLGHVRHLVVRGDAAAAAEIALPATSLAELLAAEPHEVAVTTADLAAIMYTSGTTGAPKGVMLPHGAAVTWAEQTAEHLGLVAGETHYCSFPLFHTLAQYFATLPAWANDGCLALAERFSVSGFWDDIRHFGATSANMMGAVVSLLHAAPERADDADNPLRLAFGAPVPASVIGSFQERFGLRFVEIYGSSEANVILWNPREDTRAGSCGKPIGRFDVRLVDELDREVAPGEVGEITCRPHEPYSMMTGYYRRPDATAEAFRNLWFHTGDLARRDAEGYHFFVDRAKDAIRRRGENISSWEIETVLAKHPGVADCAAFGVPSALTEEDVMVVIVANGREALDPESIAAYCAERMPRYMVPRYVELADELPRTQTGKIEKFRLRERGATEATWDREARPSTAATVVR